MNFLRSYNREYTLLPFKVSFYSNFKILNQLLL